MRMPLSVTPTHGATLPAQLMSHAKLREKNLLSEKALKTLYFSFVYCHLILCMEFD